VALVSSRRKRPARPETKSRTPASRNRNQHRGAAHNPTAKNLDAKNAPGVLPLPCPSLLTSACPTASVTVATRLPKCRPGETGSRTRGSRHRPPRRTLDPIRYLHLFYRDYLEWDRLAPLRAWAVKLAEGVWRARIFLLKLSPPYGTIDLLFWEEEMSARQDAARTGEGGQIVAGLHAQLAVCANGFPRSRRAILGAQAGRSRLAIGSPVLLFSSQIFADSTRNSQSSRIARKLLKTLAGAPVYPERPGASNLAAYRVNSARWSSQIPAAQTRNIAPRVSAAAANMNLSPREAACCA
jgi:hypothetical protein